MKVLVVDDDVVSRMVLMHLVDASGAHDIAEAEDGADAWEQLQQGLRPAICFCDLRMPRLSGMELLQKVKADPALAGIAFVMVSSANEGAIVEQASGLGAAGYIIKPFQAEQVRSHLGSLACAPDAETPRQTMQRLGIGGERLLAYLGGFGGQVTAAAAELPALLAGTGRQATLARIERLQAGCQTLGLNRPAAALRALGAGAFDAEALGAVLADTAAAVARQTDSARRECEQA